MRDLRVALTDQGQVGWIDSRDLRGGDFLRPAIEKSIEEASAYAVLISTDALQSKWVGKELRHALEVRDERGQIGFPVIPLCLNATKLGVLEAFFEEEPAYIPVSSDAGGIATAASLLQQQASRFEAAGFGGFIRALQAIVNGIRDRTLAEAAELNYSMAAEILFPIETLEKAGR